MRLPIVENLTRTQRFFLIFWKWFLRGAPGPMLVASYKKTFFGNAWAQCMEEGMRSTRHWKKGEVELFAAFISQVNSCAY